MNKSNKTSLDKKLIVEGRVPPSELKPIFKKVIFDMDAKQDGNIPVRQFDPRSRYVNELRPVRLCTIGPRKKLLLKFIYCNDSISDKRGDKFSSNRTKFEKSILTKSLSWQPILPDATAEPLHTLSLEVQSKVGKSSVI